MSIARVFALALLVAAPAYAHPVSQGAMDISISPSRVLLRAFVSDEEILVETAYGANAGLPRLQALKDHGAYLLRHIGMSIDGRPLAGRVLKTPANLAEKPVYELEFPLPLSQGAENRPKRLKLEEDLLREFEYAPGNRWEAAFILRIGHEGRPATEGLLLSPRHPVEYVMDWEGTGTTGLDRVALAKSYVGHGIMHILTGYDHLLFVAALVLAVATLWDLIAVISAFTLAHTLTLILSALNILRLPPSVVEPMIAVSIVFVAVQNVISPSRSHGWNRLLVAFAFGLFHGLGFAGGLLEAMASLNGSGALLAIAAFSLGVELGHQTVVLPIYFGLRRLRRPGRASAARDALIRRVGSATIALGGAFYLVASLRGW